MTINSSYGTIPVDQLYLVRAMSLAEFQSLKAAGESTVFTAKDNSAKAADGNGTAAYLEELGISGKTAATRNTLHFCLNALVEDHAYGKFNHEVIAIMPLAANLAPSGPSSFSEVDVVFPFRDGSRAFEGVSLFVREDLAEQAGADGQALPFAAFAPGQAASTVQQFLQQRGAPVEKAGMHAWAGHSPAREEIKGFVADLQRHCGHGITPGLHAGTAEDGCESTLASFCASTRELFESQLLYEDSTGCQRENLERATVAAFKLKVSAAMDAKHPDTRAYMRTLQGAVDQVTLRAKEFVGSLREFRQGDYQMEAELLRLAPPVCHASLLRSLNAFREENPVADRVAEACVPAL